MLEQLEHEANNSKKRLFFPVASVNYKFSSSLFIGLAILKEMGVMRNLQGNYNILVHSSGLCWMTGKSKLLFLGKERHPFISYMLPLLSEFFCLAWTPYSFFAMS